MLSDISQYVQLAFDQAGDLVKKLSFSEDVRGDFDTSTGKYQSTTETFEADALDNEEDESHKSGSFNNMSERSYIIKSSTSLKVGQKFLDDGITYTVDRLNVVQQNAVVFIYIMWAKA